VVVDVIADELMSWISKYGRPGLPVAAGTVAPTGSGEMSRHGIRRFYHVAVVTPRPSTNDYVVDPAAIAEGVHNVLALAGAERALFSPPLRSVAFPLLGAGRGGLDPAVSFDWLWSALEREIAEASLWELQFFVRQRALADLIAARLAAAGLAAN
jgi:O-acetyl-ADP-ribose deacetylase (regulator of RNase III)